MNDFRIEQASRRLRTIASYAPGYAAALLNLAGEIEAADRGEEYVPEAVGIGLEPRLWALDVAAAVILGEHHRA